MLITHPSITHRRAKSGQTPGACFGAFAVDAVFEDTAGHTIA